MIIGVQVNGKTAGTIKLPIDASQEQAVAVARSTPAIARHLTGGNVAVERYRPNGILRLTTPRVSA